MQISFTSINTARLLKGSFTMLSLTILWGSYLYFTRNSISIDFWKKDEKIVEKKQLNKCYETISGSQGSKILPDCISHSYYTKYLSCYLKISPDDSRNERVLIIGSHSPVGIELTKLYEEKKVSFAEIKGTKELNLSEKSIFSVLGSIKIKYIVLLEKENDVMYENIMSFAEKNKVKVFSVVDKFSGNNSMFSYEINVGRVMGAEYIKGEKSDSVFLHVFSHLVKHKTGEFSGKVTEEKEIVSTKAAAKFVFDIVNKENPPKTSTIECFKFTSGDIIRGMKLFEKGQSGELLNKNEEEKNMHDILKDIMDFPKKRQLYATIFTIIHNNETDFENAQKLCKAYETIIENYPDLSLELLFIFVSDTFDGKSFSSLQMNEELKKKVRILFVSVESVQEMHKVLSKKEADEYLKNIGIRNSIGQFVFFTELDFYPSPAFFDVMQRCEFSEFSMIIQKPEYVSSFNASVYSLNAGKFQQLIDLRNSSSLFDYTKRYENGFDGFIGGDRNLIFAMNGFGDYHSFGLDYTAMKIPSLVNEFYGAQKLEKTKKSSKYASSLEYNEDVCRGFMSKDVDSSRKSDWGQSYDFTNTSRNNNEKGHLTYNVAAIVDDKWNISELQFYSFFDDNDVLSII